MIFFDLEMSRLDVKADIAWIAAISTTPGPEFEIRDTWTQKVEFRTMFADDEALATFRHSPKQWKAEAIPLLQALTEFNAFIRNDPEVVVKPSASGGTYEVRRTAAYNAPFDVERIMRACEISIPEVFWNGDPSALCLRQLAQWYFYANPQKTLPANFQLQTLAAHFKLKGFESANWHDPLVDCKFTVKLARYLVRRLNLA